MNIWIFNHYAQGPELPGGTRHFDLAKNLIAQGHEVTVFAAGFHYTLLQECVTYNADGYRLEHKEGIAFIWVKTYPYTRNNYKRMLNILSYAYKLFRLIPKLSLKNPDIIIGTTVHPFAPVVGAYFAKKYRSPFIFEIRDLWPQTFIDMGIWKEESLIAKFFKRIEAFSVQRADAIISLSPKTQEYLHEHYGYTNISYIPNSVDIEAFKNNITLPSNHPTLQKLETLRKSGAFLALFTGAIVQTNTIHIFLQTAQKLQYKDIYIVLVGKGQEREKYETLARSKNIKNLIFLDPVDKKLVAKLLNYADLLLLVQGNVQWGSSNKLYDYMAAAKPIITSLYAQHNNLVQQIECGYAAEYNKSDDLVKKIEIIYSLSPQEREKLGKNAYNYVYEKYNTKTMAKKLEKLCEELV